MRRIKTLLFSIVFISFFSSVFAVEEYVSTIYKEIDQTFVDKSQEVLNEILQKYQDDKNYYLIENYAQKKIRRLILNDDYIFAMDAIVIVIENNLDNDEALEMYSVISDALEEQKRQKVIQEEKKQSEIARVEKEKEKQRSSVDKEYVSSQTATGGQVYITGAETRLTNSYWNLDLGMISFTHLFDSTYDSQLTGLNYGISADYTYEYASSDSSFGVDVSGSFKFLGFGDSAKVVPIIADAEFIPKLAFNSFAKNLFFRFGMGAVISGKTQEETGVHDVERFYSPILGISLGHIKMGKSNLCLSADYFAGHLFYEDYKFAAQAKAMASLPFAETEKFSMTLNFGVKDQLFIKANGIENRASVILAVGAENVIR